MVNRIKISVRFAGPYSPAAVEQCTAACCAAHGLMEIVDEIPKPTLLLYPYAEKQLSKDDRGFVEKYGISVIDAPWDMLPQIISEISETVQRRKLPNVREVQGPYKGSELKANTAGAAAYALFIVGFTEQAEQMLDIFPWKNEFIKENFRER